MQDMERGDAPLVRYTVDEGVMTVTLDGAANGNALTVAMTEALSDVLETVDRRADVHCLLLRSSSKHFCTGGNVKDMHSGKDLMDGGVEQVRERLRTSLHRITRALGEMEVPSICAVNGAAVGAGCDLALMCDIRVAGARAVFAESFLRLGLVSGIGGAWFLSRIVGPAKALELTLTSEFIDADEARRLGIVANVYPDDMLDSEALALARRIAGSPPLALRMSKKLVRESSHCTLPAALELAANMQAILLCGNEHKQAVSAFIEQQARRKAPRGEGGAA
ncbi:enoyl-CoA hydratase-related protein [Caballeronia sp. LP006]|uniref:enoyl-CoA hydratase-related protein n=1 Tax=Caballeronia sp. LP006 TaxID=3038552 RepID=UPI002865811B|nr:enoyl-CoA hydratase-related protein [Caballeronia sp. LP006]MDR5827884.1 enoyl-CoA hydratase-related protein [Caballeronia sp. LP006]